MRHCSQVRPITCGRHSHWPPNSSQLKLREPSMSQSQLKAPLLYSVEREKMASRQKPEALELWNLNCNQIFYSPDGDSGVSAYLTGHRGPGSLRKIHVKFHVGQSGFLLSLSRGPACSMYYPRTCGICLAALLRGLSANWTATWLLYQMSPWCQASPSTGDVTATQILHTCINRTTSSSNTITWS